MTRRDVLRALSVLVVERRAPTVSTLIGTGTAGYSDQQVNDPYGVVIGPDGALYFCDLGNQRIRRLDLKTRRTSTIAGSGRKGYDGDQGRAIDAALNMPHEIQFDRAGNLYIAERDNHAIRRVDARTGIISTLAGTGTAGFSGDGGPASQAQLRQPHAIALDPEGRLLICDVGNHRIRRVDLANGRIETYAGTGERSPTADGAPLKGTPLNGPRTMAFRGRDVVSSPCGKGMRSTGSRPARPPSTTSPALASKAIPATAVLRAPPRSAARRAWPAPAAGSTSPTPRTMRSAASISRRAASRRCSEPAHVGTVRSRTRSAARCRGRTACSSTVPDGCMSATARRTAFASSSRDANTAWKWPSRSAISLRPACRSLDRATSCAALHWRTLMPDTQTYQPDLYDLVTPASFAGDVEWYVRKAQSARRTSP